ncbi:MAG: NAD(P)/FAD-dependent oxidoreductase, partial [Syntrophomonadaceae bacterium]|nr:NAD(P)/FAD-dependent oxidoreductase [Syntrophomonadaceae bacterium]
ALGAQVTLVESQDRILPQEDAEMATYLARMLRRLKVRVLTGVTVEQATAGALTVVQLSDGTQLAAEKVLAATGWTPRVEGIGLENAGIECRQGAIAVNERLQTSHPAVFAAGDVIGGWMLAHVAFAEGIVAAENAAGLERRIDYRVVPRCVFALPEFAAVGLTEAQAAAQGTVDVVRFPLKTLGMAQALGEWEGLVKLVVEAPSGQLLGGHVIGAHASELVAEIALAMRHRIPVRGIMETIHAHPTMSEALLEAAQAACGQSIHLLPGSGQWG